MVCNLPTYLTQLMMVVWWTPVTLSHDASHRSVARRDLGAYALPSKSHPVKVHFETGFSNFITIATMIYRLFDELTAREGEVSSPSLIAVLATTIYTNMILFSSSHSILSDMFRLTFRTFHLFLFLSIAISLFCTSSLDSATPKIKVNK